MKVSKTSWVLAGLILVALIVCLMPVSEPIPWEEEVSWAAFEELAKEGGYARRADVQRWIPRVDPHGQLSEYISLKEDALSFRRSLKAESEEIVVELRQEPEPGDTLGGGEGGLAGLKVVLDPGHYGGVWSEAEQRHYEVEGRMPIREGNLSYKTALTLGKALTEQGATVWFTRAAPPREPIRYVDQPDFNLEREAALWLTHQQKGWAGLWKGLFPARIASVGLEVVKAGKIERSAPHLFALSDLRRRSELSNRCRADVTLSIHFNASGNPEVNHLMVFMPGNFMPGELKSEASRYYALRQLVDGVLPTTRKLGVRVAKAMSEKMGLPSRPASRKLNSLAIEGSQGVYARNLSILKRTRGPVLLVEGPFVTHPAEYDLLMSSPGSEKLAPRIQQMSDALLVALRGSANELKRLRKPGEPGTVEGCSDWTPVW